jgi:hypothetical protein
VPLYLANKPERFVFLDKGSLGKACSGGLQTQECSKQILDGNFDMINPGEGASLSGQLR